MLGMDVTSRESLRILDEVGRYESEEGLRAVATRLCPDAWMCFANAAPKPEELPVTVMNVSKERGVGARDLLSQTVSRLNLVGDVIFEQMKY